MRAAVAVISDGFSRALGASRLIRTASLYVGLLFALLAGGGVLAELGVLTWSNGLDLGGRATTTAADAANRASLILVVGALSCLVVMIDATAVGMTLLASRFTSRPVALRSAIQRARQVFWRLLGANLVVGVTELVASAIFRLAIGVRPETVGGATFFTVDPIAGTLISIPFVLTTAGIVIADDSVGDAIGRSARLARRSLPIAIALALFGFAFNFIGGLAINQGSGIVLSIANAIHLDVTSGAASFLVAVTVGLAILSAFGSILFTVGAVVSSAQAVAFTRFGMPTSGLDRVTASEPVTAPPVEAPAGASVETAGPLAAVDPAAASRPSSPEAATAAVDGSAVDATLDAEAGPASAGRPQTEWEAWAERREPASPRGTRWITIPMRAVAAFLWIVALVGVLTGPPH